MTEAQLTERDKQQVRDHGLSVKEVERQLALFQMPPARWRLLRPCTLGDGIEPVSAETGGALAGRYGQKGPEGRNVKFVPASGAASRMFRDLLRYLHREASVTREMLQGEVRSEKPGASEVLTFMERLRDFPFFEKLRDVMERQGRSLVSLMENGLYSEILTFLLTDSGLGYARMPKGLILFHRSGGEERTAFEEHLVEAVSYVRDNRGRCVLHMTVSPEHLDNFQHHLEKVKARYEQQFGVSLEVTFSIQGASTDTIAVSPDNRPFRDKQGRLVFRPGGHGSLLENLNGVDGDTVFLKNIDNVVPDSRKPITDHWKKVLGGCLMSARDTVFDWVERLHSGSLNDADLEEALDFAQGRLNIPIPPSVKREGSSTIRDFLLKKLNRPIRVAGMVKNEGEPGGGPFWVAGADGTPSIQIVERAQLDPKSDEQQEIFESATHFNPVDLVCSVRDWQGKPFDLSHYVDPQAIIITQKSTGGRDLKALEHPGLWNGAMADWITLLVEVPIETFNPVKTVNDLLREAHQGDGPSSTAESS